MLPLILIIYAAIYAPLDFLLILLVEFMIELFNEQDNLVQFILFEVSEFRHDIVGHIPLERNSLLMQFAYLLIISVRLQYIGCDVMKHAVYIHVDRRVLRHVVAVRSKKLLKIAHGAILLLFFGFLHHILNLYLKKVKYTKASFHKILRWIKQAQR